jgi:diketogulonate reductase-like aldo/keto reductase
MTFDPAWLYGNEDAIGQAIKEAIAESNNQLKREDLFIVSKVWNTHHSRELVRKCLNETLNNLGTDYIDLYLIHWPVSIQHQSHHVLFVCSNFYSY